MKFLDGLDKQMPRQWPHGVVNKATNLVSSLTNLLSADDESDETFYSTHTLTKLSKVSNKRSAARNAIADARDVLNNRAMAIPAELTAMEGEITRAKWQSVRYGQIVFVRHEDALANTEPGAGMRAQLKAVWDSHMDNDEGPYHVAQLRLEGHD